MSVRPNILFITTDQQRWDHTGLTGLKGITTPALDRIGSEGVHFTRAYCPSPLCTPTRVTLLTGQYPSLHRSHTLGVTADPFPELTVPQRLKQVGYQTALVGKSHFTERTKEEGHLLAAIGEYCSTEANPFDGPYVGFDQVQLASGHNANTVPEMHYKRYLQRQGVTEPQWFPKWMNGSYDGEYAGPWDIPEEHHNTAWVGNETERWLKQYREPGNPWFLWMSFEDPHEPMYCPEPWYSRVDRSELKPFESDRPGEFDDKPVFYAAALRGDWSAVDDEFMTPCVFPRRRLDGQAVSALQATVGMIGFIDHRVGRVIRLLEETGELANTVIVFTSDHGEMHGHHGFWGKGLTAYEDCQRVPLMIWAPGMKWRKGHSDAIANLVDLPRLFLQLAGLGVPQGIQGMNLLGFLEGNLDRYRSGTLIESNITANCYQTTYVNDSHKVVIYRDEAKGEVYDLKEDPDQYDNLWDKEPELRADLLLELARQKMKEEGAAHPRRSFG
ncbi:MAG TPA: sulfatase-like hydrolase/transferase [Tepidisphaeraceae bacterium]|jgi:uncharacterized sulfatase|nr:sulfatase-like hydrolase/transferase [Tepidisphaeraceae bacterium]